MKGMLTAAVLAVMAGTGYAAGFEELRGLKAGDIAVAMASVAPALPAPVMKAAASARMELKYMKENYLKIDTLANDALTMSGVNPGDMTVAQYIGAYRQARAEFNLVYAAAAPTKAAADAVDYINGKMIEVMESLAKKHSQ